MTGGPAAAALEAGRDVPHAPHGDGGDRDRRVQRRDLRAQRADPRRRGAAPNARRRRRRSPTGRASTTRSARSLGPAARREALVRLDRRALRRRRHRQPALARRGGRSGEEAAGAHLHGRAPLGRLRPGAAAVDRRADGRVLRRGAVGGRARGDLRGARRPARRGVSRSLPLRRASDVAGRRRDPGRRHGEASTAYVAPDALAAAAVSPLVRVSKFLLSASSPLVVSLLFGRAGLPAPLPAGAATRDDGRRPGAGVCDGAARDAPAIQRSPRCSASPTRNRTPAAGGRSSSSDLELARMTVTPRAGRAASSFGGASAVVRARASPSRRRCSPCSASPSPLIASAVDPPEAEGGPEGVRRPVPGQPPGARLRAPLRPQLQRRARRRRRERTRAGAVRAGAGRCRTTGSASCRRTRSASSRAGWQNRDIEQVALLAELQRTTGGNSAEILDTVVATIRERADIRRLVMHADRAGPDGALDPDRRCPSAGTAFIWVVQPEVMRQLLHQQRRPGRRSCRRRRWSRPARSSFSASSTSNV